MSGGGFRLKGWHVLGMLLGFFGLIIVANTIFITLAVKSFPGEQEKKSYLQGLHYNEALERRAAQEALGWEAAITEADLDGDTATVRLSFFEDDRPLDGLAVSGVLSRPADDDFDHIVEFEPVARGAYIAEVSGVGAGAWVLHGKAIGAAGEEFELSAKIFLNERDD